MTAKHSLSQWLEHFENLHPVGIDMGLTRVAQVWKKLCERYDIKQLASKKMITVAGTNGKGSACQMLTLLLSAQGYRVGTYTSPHIHHFRERVQMNAQSVDDELLEQAFSAIETTRGDISLSYFEATTLAGLLVFAWQAVDFAVLEVGLGGRLDAVNIIDADAVLITSIGLDHEAYLGNDLSCIALEKAGVCRPHKPCVYAEQGVYDSLRQFAKSQCIPLIINGEDYHIDGALIHWGARTWRIPEHIASQGAHQMANCAGVLVLLEALGYLPDGVADVDTLIQTELERFSLAGRLQRITRYPDVVVDVAHNEASAHALANYLRQQSANYERIYAVVGMLRDKDHSATLHAFDGLFSRVFCGRTDGERGLDDETLATVVREVLSCEVVACGSLVHALVQAKSQAKPNDLIMAFGSFLVVEALT